MKEEFFDFAILLEKTLASFYEKIMKDERLERIKSVLEFQSAHSVEHAKKLTETEKNYKKPQLGESLILDYQNKLTGSIFDKIIRETDIGKIIEILADSEEKLGDLYKQMAATMRDISSYYGDIADEIEQIGEDEYRHRDLLLMEKEG